MLWQVRRLMFSSFTASVTFFYFLCLCVDSHLHTHTHKHVQTDSIAVKTNESFETVYVCAIPHVIKWYQHQGFCLKWNFSVLFSLSFSSSTTCPTHTYTMIVLCNFLCVREFIAVLSSFCISSEPVCICVSYQSCVSVWGWEPYIIVVLYQIVYHTKTHIDKSRKADTHTRTHLGFKQIRIVFIINLQGLSECLPVCHDPFL